MNINQNIEEIKVVKADIRQAIENKGVNMNNIPFTDYADKIGEITGGEGDDHNLYIPTIFNNTYDFYNGGSFPAQLYTGTLEVQNATIEFTELFSSSYTYTFEVENLTYMGKLFQISNQQGNHHYTFEYFETHFTFKGSISGETVINLDIENNDVSGRKLFVFDLANRKVTFNGVDYYFEVVGDELPKSTSYWRLFEIPCTWHRLDKINNNTTSTTKGILYRPYPYSSHFIKVKVYAGYYQMTYDYQYYGWGVEDDIKWKYLPVRVDETVCFDNILVDTLNPEYRNITLNTGAVTYFDNIDLSVKNLCATAYIPMVDEIKTESRMINNAAILPRGEVITENGTYRLENDVNYYYWVRSNIDNKEPFDRVEEKNYNIGWTVSQYDVIEVKFRGNAKLVGSSVPWLFGKSDEKQNSSVKNKYGVELNCNSAGDCWLNFWMGSKLGKFFFEPNQWVTLRTYTDPANTAIRIIEVDDGGYHNTAVTVSNMQMTENITTRTGLFTLYSEDINGKGYSLGNLENIDLQYIRVWRNNEDYDLGNYWFRLEEVEPPYINNYSYQCETSIIINGEHSPKILNATQIIELSNYKRGWNEVVVDVAGGGTTGSLALVDGTKFQNSTFTEIPDYYDFSNITDGGNMFLGCTKLVTINNLNLTNANEMGRMFEDCESLQSILHLDSSNATNMYGMFCDCKSLQSIPELDTRNVTGMTIMFLNCKSLQTIPELDTSKVTTMNGMFDLCSSLQTIPLLNTSNVTDMSSMFYYCSSLQTIPELDTSNVTDMREMFLNCKSLQTIPSLNTSNVTNIYNLFGSTDSEYLTDVGGWINLNINWSDDYGLAKCPNLTYQSCINILNGLADMTGTDGRTLKVHQNFLDTVGDEINIGINKNWTISA